MAPGLPAEPPAVPPAEPPAVPPAEPPAEPPPAEPPPVLPPPPVPPPTPLLHPLQDSAIAAPTTMTLMRIERPSRPRTQPYISIRDESRSVGSARNLTAPARAAPPRRARLPSPTRT